MKSSLFRWGFASKLVQRSMLIRYLSMVMLFLCVSFLSFYARSGTGFIALETPDMEYRKDNVPWPWGKEIEFPWREAHGTYSMDINGQRIYISLRVIHPETLSNTAYYDKKTPLFVSIRLFDSVTCKTLATGRGFKSGHLVRAQFVNLVDNEVYVMSLHTFNEEVAKMSGVYTNRKDMVMVASVGLLKQAPTGDPRQMMTSALIRVADASASCEFIQKKLQKDL